MITRLYLLAHAAGMLDELATEAGVSLSDDSLGIARQLDATLRDLGADTDNVAAGEALIEYHVLARLRYALAARVDFDATAIKRGRSQVFEQVDSLLTAAAARAAAYGHPVTAVTGGSTGARLISLNLDFLEYDALDGAL